MNIKYDFQELRKFLEDISFLVQSGGARNLLQSGGGFGEFIAGVIKNLPVILFVIIVIYGIYLYIKSGYSRTLHSLITFSFYHKANMEAILGENDLLYSSIDKMAEFYKTYSDNNCTNPYFILKLMYKYNTDDHGEAASVS